MILSKENFNSVFFFKLLQVIEASLYEDMKQEVIQLQEIQSLVNAQCLDLKDSIEKETQFQQQLLAIQERLKVKQNTKNMLTSSFQWPIAHTNT